MLLFHIFVYSERTITFRGNRLLLHTEDAESNKISFFNLCYNYNSNLLKRSSIALKPRSKQCPHWLSTLLSYVSNLIKVFHATTMNFVIFQLPRRDCSHCLTFSCSSSRHHLRSFFSLVILPAWLSWSHTPRTRWSSLQWSFMAWSWLAWSVHNKQDLLKYTIFVVV